MSYLKEKFKVQWRYSNCNGDYRDGFRELVKQYKKPKRHYHTFEGHIEFCVRAFFEHAVWQVENPAVLMWQLLLHDSVMDFHATDNDVMSARYARKFLTKYGVDVGMVDSVANAIVYHDHQNTPKDESTKFGLDIDLLILAQSRKFFDEYENNIRKEYSFVARDIFCEKRADILEGFLNNRSSVFLTKYFKNRFEKQARENLKISIKRLRG